VDGRVEIPALLAIMETRGELPGGGLSVTLKYKILEERERKKGVEVRQLISKLQKGRAARGGVAVHRTFTKLRKTWVTALQKEIRVSGRKVNKDRILENGWLAGKTAFTRSPSDFANHK